MKIGDEALSRIVMLLIVTSSRFAPSTVSSARPWLPSNVQLVIVMFLKPPLLSVPNLMRPKMCPAASGPRFFQVPANTDPTS